jgi:hypothetical protein
MRSHLPSDAVGWAALGLGVALLVLALARGTRVGRAVERVRPSVLLIALAGCAALLSAAYVAYYLKGGPRIIDATSYFLEGRALSRGSLAFPVPEPATAFRGRFLLAAGDGSALSVIFPPGYPAVLALGFLVHAPLAVGPLIAAALVVVTHALGRRLFGREDVALGAAALTVVCAALRYHTADTMSHGWAALLVAFALLATCSSREVAGMARIAWGAAAGLSAGWLCATRPVTGAVLVAACGGLLLRVRGARAPFWVGLIPGLALLLIHQKLATGTWLGSTQFAYYATADGPPGCFRYGFGRGVGCVYEHGDFVARCLPDGYGPLEALRTTGRRLWYHALDLLNWRPLGLLLPLAAYLVRKQRSAWLLAGVAAMVVVGYAPFYFDANYPGGGARLFADVLPLEHVLIAAGLAQLRLARFAVPAALVGFAIDASHEHTALSAREGGRPMFETSVLAAQGVDRGLVFVDTDHGFNLGHVPGATAADRELVVAHYRGDAQDALLRSRLGMPRSYRYRYDPFAPQSVGRLEPYAPTVSDPLRFEAEGLWPATRQAAGFAFPTHLGSGCASAGRGLRLVPGAEGRAEVTVELFAPRAGLYEFVASWVAYEAADVEVSADIAGSVRVAARRVPQHACWQLGPARVQIAEGPVAARVTATSSAAVLDYVDLRPVSRPHE